MWLGSLPEVKTGGWMAPKKQGSWSIYIDRLLNFLRLLFENFIIYICLLLTDCSPAEQGLFRFAGLGTGRWASAVDLGVCFVVSGTWQPWHFPVRGYWWHPLTLGMALFCSWVSSIVVAWHRLLYKLWNLSASLSQ